MIDGQYTEKDWQAVVAAFPHHLSPSSEVLSIVRRRLESAAARYVDHTPFAEQMRGAAKKREHWKRIHDDAVALRKSISTVDRWLAPIWPEDDPKEKARAVRFLDELALHARMVAADYAFDDQHLSPRERLNSDVAAVWTDVLGRGFGWSTAGPAVRFFQAVLGPIVEDPPAPTTVRDILEREEARRRGSLAGGHPEGPHKRAMAKKRSSRRTRTVPGAPPPPNGSPNV